VSVLDAIFVLSIIAALISLPFFGMDWPIPKVVFGGAVIVGLIVAASSKSISQFQIQQRLGSAPSGTAILINGHPVQNGQEVLGVLRSLDDLPAHHSHPGRRITIEVHGKSHFTLWLGRDSDNPREYWVFDPRHLITQNNEIGRIVTPVFDAY
jgi:hypothetical protein